MAFTSTDTPAHDQKFRLWITKWYRGQSTVHGAYICRAYIYVCRTARQHEQNRGKKKNKINKHNWQIYIVRQYFSCRIECFISVNTIYEHSEERPHTLHWGQSPIRQSKIIFLPDWFASYFFFYITDTHWLEGVCRRKSRYNAVCFCLTRARELHHWWCVGVHANSCWPIIKSKWSSVRSVICCSFEMTEQRDISLIWIVLWMFVTFNDDNDDVLCLFIILL